MGESVSLEALLLAPPAGSAMQALGGALPGPPQQLTGTPPSITPTQPQKPQLR